MDGHPAQHAIVPQSPFQTNGMTYDQLWTKYAEKILTEEEEEDEEDEEEDHNHHNQHHHDFDEDKSSFNEEDHRSEHNNHNDDIHRNHMFQSLHRHHQHHFNHNQFHHDDDYLSDSDQHDDGDGDGDDDDDDDDVLAEQVCRKILERACVSNEKVDALAFKGTDLADESQLQPDQRRLLDRIRIQLEADMYQLLLPSEEDGDDDDDDDDTDDGHSKVVSGVPRKRSRKNDSTTSTTTVTAHSAQPKLKKGRRFSLMKALQKRRRLWKLKRHIHKAHQQYNELHIDLSSSSRKKDHEV